MSLFLKKADSSFNGIWKHWMSLKMLLYIGSALYLQQLEDRKGKQKSLEKWEYSRAFSFECFLSTFQGMTDSTLPLRMRQISPKDIYLKSPQRHLSNSLCIFSPKHENNKFWDGHLGFLSLLKRGDITKYENGGKERPLSWLDSIRVIWHSSTPSRDVL